MTTSDKGKKLITHFESIRTEAYKVTPEGNWTYGIGAETKEDGTPVQEGDTITKDEAIALFSRQLKQYETNVIRLIFKPLKQHQFDALVSFVYNVGSGNFANSTIRKKININPDDRTISAEFAKWNKSAGKVLNGLTKRRSAESHYYFSGELVL